MEMNRRWMYERKVPNSHLLRREFVTGLHAFLDAAFSNPDVHSGGLIPCPCRACENDLFGDKIKVGKHLIKNGFMDDYYVWSSHGEGDQRPTINQNMHEQHENVHDHMETFSDVVVDAFHPEIREEHTGGRPTMSGGPEKPNKDAQLFFDLMDDANQPLYEGCDQTILEWCAEHLNYKTQHSISAAACDNMIKWALKAIRPEDREKLPQGFRELQKLMGGLGLKHITYDVCKNNDFLYRGADAEYQQCPVCGRDRYKKKKTTTGKKIARKKLWYFLITERLQRLYMSRKTAEHMTWHRQCNKESVKMIHPAGGEAWKHFNTTYPEFDVEPRNVRLGLCTDGFTPFNGKSAKQYSCWPVFIAPYNLPPDLCMNDESIFLSLIISGRKRPGQNIDVLLRRLIDELKTLWTDGAVTYDSYRQKNFTMRPALMWTISDFPAYGMLSGWSTHGRLACPYCMGRTKSFRLPCGGKPCWFDCHRQFLPTKHPARNDKVNFIKGRSERDSCPERLDGAEVYNSVQHIPVVENGHAQQEDPGLGTNHNWKKKSIFWELPYWSSLRIRHNLDVMHIEKNVFENIFRTIMDDCDRTKDNIKSREDLEKYTTRKELFLKRRPGMRALKPKATYTLSKQQRRYVCQWLKDLRFQDGHVSNIGRCVKDVEAGTLYSNMKSHDCHVFMQRLLPIAFRDFLPDAIWGALTEVSNFFRALCATEIGYDDMVVLGKSIRETICKLEMFFPPSFFDSMEHLIIHLPYEALVGGPVFYRWMYPFERKMFVLKSMVKNKNRVEGSICQAYLNSEITNFCSHYFDREINTRSKRLKRNEVSWSPEFTNQLPVFIPKGKPSGKAVERGLSVKEYNAAMYYILMNCEEVDHWVREFDKEFRDTIDPDKLEEFRMKEFTNWFWEKIPMLSDNEVDKRLRTLAAGGRDIVTIYQGYTINGLKFQTEVGGRTLNNGICLRATTDSEDTIDYYGELKEVVEMSFADCGPIQKIVLFKCTWYDNSKAITIHPKYGIVDINPRYKLKTDEEFVLASQASQVYYVPYPSSHVLRRRKGTFAVCVNRARHIINISSLVTLEEEVNIEQEYYHDNDPPRPSTLAVDFNNYSVPNLTDGEVEEVEIVDLENDAQEGDQVEGEEVEHKTSDEESEESDDEEFE